MLLKNWDLLPETMKNDEVKKYYDILKKKNAQLIIKRIFDIVVSLIMILILSPVFLIVSILIKCDSKGSVFYRQERVTQYGRVFRIFKFRTMVSNADKMGTLVTVKNDNRITGIGNKIRKCRLDEIPQLINVLIGDMSFVGTRPEVKKYVDKYTDEMMATLLLPAGVTSLGSIKFSNEDEIIAEAISKNSDVDITYVSVILPQKMKMNLEYLLNVNVIKDINICYRTVFRGDLW